MLAPVATHAAVHSGASPGFGAQTMADEVTAGLELHGMTAIVTGCNSGIGYETMRVLAACGAHVIGTARSKDKAVSACRGVDGKTTPLVLDLGGFESVVACSRQIEALGVPVDRLICNAGIVRRGRLQRRFAFLDPRAFAPSAAAQDNFTSATLS